MVEVDLMAAKVVRGYTADQAMFWSICPFCEYKDLSECTECLGTDTDAIPWAELFKDARITYGPCRGPHRQWES